MVGLSFSFPKLLLKIYTGEKDQTIRVENPVRIEQMNRLGIQLFWKQRSKYGFKLNETKYREGFKIRFLTTSCRYNYKYNLSRIEYEDEEEWWHGLPSWERGKIAVRDGFDSYRELVDALMSRYGDLNGMVFDVIRWPKLRKLSDHVDWLWRKQMLDHCLIDHIDGIEWMCNYDKER
jgi:hypothetical protein